MRTYITSLMLLSLVMLTSCGGGSGSSSSSSQDGNFTFSVTNGVSQDFVSASIVTNSTNTTLYDGPFLCLVGNTCKITIQIDSIPQETYNILFYNVDGDLVGAWESRSPPSDGFIRINASATNFGAYLFGQLDIANPESSDMTIAEISDYFSDSDAATLAKGQVPDFFLNLKLYSDIYSGTPGAQSVTMFYKQLQTSLANGAVLQTPLSYSSASSVQAKAMVLATGMPANNCSTLTSTAGKIFGAIGGWGGGQAVVDGDIVNKIPYLGPVAKSIAALFGAACDNETNRFQAIFDDLRDIKTQLDKLDTKLDSIQASITAQNNKILNQTAWNAINTSYRDVMTAIDNMNGLIAAYQHVLDNTTRGTSYKNLADLFAKTGGLYKQSLTVGTTKNALQGGAIARLNDLMAQKKALDDLASGSNYATLKNNLNIVCSNDGLSSADGDIFAIRKICNTIIAKVLIEVAVYQKQASDMIRDELTVINQAESIGLTNWSAVPYAGDLTQQQKLVLEASSQALNNVLTGLPNTYNLLDGLSTDLVKSINSKEMNCNKNVSGSLDTHQPNILAWYPNPLTTLAPYIVAYCSNGTQTTYSKFYYGTSKAARNVMGVLVGSEVSYTSGTLTANPYTSTITHKDLFRLKSQASMTVNNQTVFCGGQSYCTVSDRNGVGSQGNNYVLAYFNLDLIPPFYESTSSKASTLSAALAITDYLPDKNGLNFTYLLGFVFNTTQDSRQYQFSCLTPDCKILGDQQTIQFKNGRADGTGPAVNMSKPYENTFNIQIN